jgi:hypothetical protein
VAYRILFWYFRRNARALSGGGMTTEPRREEVEGVLEARIAGRRS